jgi:CRISPR-associated protein Cas5a/b/c
MKYLNYYEELFMNKGNSFFIKVDIFPSSTINAGIITGTKSRPSFKIPPLTTIIGALSYPLAKIKGYSESGVAYMPALLASIIKGVYITISGSLIPYSSISKMWFYREEEKIVKSDVYAYQRIYFGGFLRPNPPITLIYIFDPIKSEEKLGNKWMEEIVISAWSISRLGDKESIVSISNIEEGFADEIYTKEITTNFLIPLLENLRIEPIDGGDVEIFTFYDWRYVREPKLIGLPLVNVALVYDHMEFTTKKARVYREEKEFLAYKVKISNNEEYLIGW